MTPPNTNQLIKSRVTQGSVSGAILDIIFIADFHASNSTITGRLTDDTFILTSHEKPIVASANLNDHRFYIEDSLNDVE